ncbi:MAG: DUF397 domain-containing protein [Pseudonocardiaceae bacterium]
MSDTGYWVWRKSSFSNGGNNACVEVGRWRKSSFSEGNNNACVEVAHTTDTVGVRDTKHRAAGHLAFTPRAWTTFVHDLPDR